MTRTKPTRGLPVVFRCSCGNERCSTELIVRPHVAEGHLALRVRGSMLGVVLDPVQRSQLAGILTDADWTGDHPDLGA